ncbi:UDP-N-acetylmuramoyl-L-alanyl-D-glutamate--2,6-diaminopimelate ligase [Aliarcobacter trophiarum LMG 25534]|uniref:UDP-N-acetylmuramoyl-L-alanyl-D-glutamate--2,6-diaminopimelate ligase n=1 Tax=Aliarcobacter trophiarum LMG 25534 TaxID=1032241 RepID=A0AAD0VMD1_9BACT|nr:UDP-N-acetylmuramoyl-L-alanyl-D-glutamate--2,6-diaminopimelate ligase [Aliarcobacter trophiarum]AXK49323.1 UDP-N-acetylmuramoylalanyl-D-glutamate 2,6-diaminopimelate ligase [Aliarcobacter trophiarum LMG 25534]RXI27728.1 UDP-N-acetylmuramoyl-L-alanyl-D-glutamate--2,6-diaminopimelate ligase [Aliarcobacter trophiarum]RXJ90110.1 UDP-N-acetylmuramoyl-L-alanyl-D-glutamate--2,6-diaminopimelate ligase [Aliarcobacter trophiarum LMG 25534]
MILEIENKIFTDNTKELKSGSTFVVSKQNEIFEEMAKSSGYETISSENLKNYLDMSSIKIIGITGTNGKTTTATTIYTLLLNLGYKVALQGTRGFFINGVQVEEYSLTTPVQLGNFANIQKAMKNSCSFFIMEVSSHAISQNRVEGLEFFLKIHTNITRDHLDFHNSIEEYIDVKNSFLSDESLKLVNIDDKVLKYNQKNSFTYSLEKLSNFKVLNYKIDKKLSVEFSFLDKNYSFSSNLLGVFNIYNQIASIAAVYLATKKPIDDICEALKDFKGVSGRVEVVSTEPLVIVDFAHTPDGMEEVLKSFLNKDIVCVFGAGGNRDSAKRPLMGQIAKKYSKYVVVTSDNPRFENPNEIIKDILSGIEDMSNVFVEADRKEAIKKALNLTNKNSVVLVLGKGDEATQIIEDKKIAFSDKKEILNLLK